MKTLAVKVVITGDWKMHFFSKGFNKELSISGKASDFEIFPPAASLPLEEIQYNAQYTVQYTVQ